MKRREIRDQARIWLDDTTTPGELYENEELDRYADEAVREACIRARLLVDSHTPAVTQIPVQPGVASYKLHKAIIFARRIGFLSANGQQEHMVRRVTYDMLDNRRDLGWTRNIGGQNWKLATSQRPDFAIQDLEERTIRLVGIPTAGGTLQLTVVRWPLECEVMTKDSMEPCIPEEWHLPLAHWIVYRARLNPDAEKFDAQSSATHYAQYESFFGPRPTVKDIRSMAHDRAGEIASYEF